MKLSVINQKLNVDNHIFSISPSKLIIFGFYEVIKCYSETPPSMYFIICKWWKFNNVVGVFKLLEPTDFTSVPGLENCSRFVEVIEQNKIQWTFYHDCIIHIKVLCIELWEGSNDGGRQAVLWISAGFLWNMSEDDLWMWWVSVIFNTRKLPFRMLLNWILIPKETAVRL